jgi:cyclomaltodextrinase / maltogenic alpha-amylase / neopullulanase
MGISNPYPGQRQQRKEIFLTREKDWRIGGIVYQIFVDRFAPSLQLDSKRHLYQAPRSLHPWHDLPKRGVKDPNTRYWSHELAFWGGDLNSVLSKIKYLKQLGVDTIYLNPIFEAMSNHKYDTYDYEQISSEYGSMDDFKAFIIQLKKNNLKLILDGVFNHMAVGSSKFTEAVKSNASEYRDWFVFGNQFPTGVRLWHNAPSLPELNLKNTKVRDYLFNGDHSIVKRYLALGIDGWRLDTAIELGYDYLFELTTAAHDANPSSVVVGELNNYPQGWSPAMDGTMLLPLRDLIIQTVKGAISAKVFSRTVEKMIAETGIETILKSWVLLENHDTSRIVNDLPSFSEYKTAKTLQFTLPGTINLYMGEEIGTPGGDDPLNRAPMNWALAEKGNEYSKLHHQLIQLRQNYRALRIGDIKFLDSDHLIAYIRNTNRFDDTIVVVINPTNRPIQEMIMITDPLLKSHNRFIDLLTGEAVTTSYGILLPISLSAKSFYILKPDLSPINGYSAYKNIQED